MIHAGEVIGALDLIKNITVRIKHIDNSEIVVFINNRKVIVEYKKQINQESNVTTEAVGIIMKIRNEIENSSIHITLKLLNNKLRPRRLYN